MSRNSPLTMAPRHAHRYMRCIMLLLLVLLSPFTASGTTVTAPTTTTTTLRGGRTSSILATNGPSRRGPSRASSPPAALVAAGRRPSVARRQLESASTERDQEERVKLAPSQLQALLALEREWQAWEWAEENGTSAKAWCDAWNSNIDLTVACDAHGMITDLWVGMKVGRKMRDMEDKGVMGVAGVRSTVEMSGQEVVDMLGRVHACMQLYPFQVSVQQKSPPPAAAMPCHAMQDRRGSRCTVRVWDIAFGHHSLHRPPPFSRGYAVPGLPFPWWGLSGNLEMLGHFPRLQYVDLRFSGFDGEIPASIGNATALQHLDLSGVSIAGWLPSTFSRLTALTFLSVGDPVYLWPGDFTWLNDFQQDDPTDILSITATYKTPVLQAPMAHLFSLAPLTRLQHLALRNLYLTPGPLPPALSTLTLLTHLDIQFLPATSLPSWIAMLSSLKYLDVTGNFSVHRSAPFPTDWMALTGLETVRAGLNGFTGSIPSTISALTALTDLELYYNNISGTIPAAIAHLPLTYLSLFSNMLSGTIPALDSLPLSSLDLSYNHLSGSLPTALGSIPELLKLGHNDLEGPLPTCFEDVRGQIDLSFNKLSGSIPLTFIDAMPWHRMNLTSSGLTCPADGSECGQQQSNTSSFCTVCLSFCSSCTPRALSAPTTPPAASQATAQPSHTAFPPSPPTTTAARSMPNAATISLALVVAVAALLIVLQERKRTHKGFRSVPLDIEM
ncbi:unnamed protein product [Closterium sp. Naga37s-1]|nr:unnamed protein product [Closterium sp. Naga37s-1]